MTDVMDLLHELYDELPTIECRGLCSNSCGLIDMSDAERERIRQRGYDIEPFTADRARRWANDEPLDCAALSVLKTCNVYSDRPLICRIWGVAESMPCPHGCRPSRLLTDQEGYDLILRSMQIGGHPRLTFSKKEREFMARMVDDPEVGPLFARFIRGDRSLEPKIVEILAERRRGL